MNWGTNNSQAAKPGHDFKVKPEPVAVPGPREIAGVRLSWGAFSLSHGALSGAIRLKPKFRQSLLQRIDGAVALAAIWFAIGGAIAQTNVQARLDYNSFRMISDRNIFNPNRYARGPGQPARTESRPASRVESFTLAGLLAYEKGVFAFFDGTSASYKKTIVTNGDISEFKVNRITPDLVQLASGTNEFVMRVGMQVRREDEGDWFLTEAGQTSRNRVVISRGRSRSATGESVTGLPEGTTEAGTAGEPEIIVVTPESTTETPEANGNGEAAPAAVEPANNTSGITDPVLLRLMQRRQELSQ